MPLGNLVRLIPLELDEVPLHPSIVNYLDNSSRSQQDSKGDRSKSVSFASDDTSPYPHSNGQPDLQQFIRGVLDEATNFVDHDMPTSFKKKSTKSNAPASATIDLLQRMISSDEIKQIPFQEAKVSRKALTAIQSNGEAWFARKSTHTNKSELGTATWDEFDARIRVRHSEHEVEYTPDVFDCFKVLDWDQETDEFGGDIGEYGDVRMSVYEMAHKLPSPLQPRVFPVLIVTAKTGRDGFIIVQIPINLQALPESFYSSGRNLKEGDSGVKRKKPVISIYTSIERCTLTAANEITWIMATASDAGGYLPMWAQKLGVPGAIVNDVGLFMKWIDGKRASTDKGSS